MKQLVNMKNDKGYAETQMRARDEYQLPKLWTFHKKKKSFRT